MTEFSGKRVLVTGAGRGLGAAFAVVFADLGADVVLTGRNIEPLSALAESIRLRTGKAPEYHAIDLADISRVTLFAKSWRDEKQKLDILVNNGAQWLSGRMDEHDAYAIANTITANVTGTLLFTRGLLPLLRNSPAADIVNIISVSGMTNVPLQGASVAYIASKYGQAGMTDALRQELRGQNVRITAIYPANIADISPLNPVSWNETRTADSWATNRDIVETVIAALNRPRHISYSSIMLETATSNFHGHKG